MKIQIKKRFSDEILIEGEAESLKEFAEKNGIERTTIYSFLSGRNSANPTEKKILEALGLSKQEDKKVKIILKKK